MYSMRQKKKRKSVSYQGYILHFLISPNVLIIEIQVLDF